MKQKILIFISLVAFIFESCRPFSYLTVDLTEPVKEDLPAGIQSLTLVNRAADQCFTDDPSDTIQYYFYNSEFNLDTVIHDIKSSDTLLQALGNVLFESGRYDIVIPEDRFLMKDSVNSYSSPMYWDQVKAFTTAFNTDAVLSLDYFKTSVSAEFGQQSWFDINAQNYIPSFYAIMRIGYTAHFRVYNPENKEINNSYLIYDTLLWETRGLDLKNMFRQFTTVKQGLAEAGIDAALKLSEKIAPAWKPTPRAFFTKGHNLLRQTKSLVQGNDWQAAMDLWTGLLEKTSSKSLRSKLEFNMALASEMQGDLNEAIRWGVESYKTRYRPVTYKYLNTLKYRKLLLSKHDENN